MRTPMIVIALFALSMASPAFAQGDKVTVYFWENAKTYGWSEVVDVLHTATVLPNIKKKLSITELCGRLVCRQMRRDDSSRSHSLRREDYCIFNGGRL